MHFNSVLYILINNNNMSTYILNTSLLANLLKKDQDLLRLPREGEVVDATLIAKGPRKAFFDLGQFGSGIVFGSEFINAKDTLKRLEKGDMVSAKIVIVDGEEGCIELSLAAAGKQKLWQVVRDLKESNDVIAVKILAANSGGLMATLNDLKAFLPVSQLSNEHYPRVPDNNKELILEELKKFVGTDMNVKIIDVNPRTNKLIISEREITDENVKTMLEKYKVDQIVEGIVSGVADFGVFVRFTENPGIEGLVHISELDHKLIDNPKDFVKVDDIVRVKIIDMKEGRVSLSIKALKPDPWENIENKYKVGDALIGTVKKFNPYGAFIDIDNEIQGLIHVSEFGGIDEMKRQLELHKDYMFVIDTLKPLEKRLFLKLKK